jgi:hypothetical protein
MKYMILLLMLIGIVSAKPKWEKYGFEDGMVHYVDVNSIKQSSDADGTGKLIDLNIRYFEVKNEPTDVHLTISCTDRNYVYGEVNNTFESKGNIIDNLWKKYCKKKT